VTIAIFLNPGMRADLPSIGSTKEGQSNRSFEYDSLGDAYAKFLLNEAIPFVTNKYSLAITENPEMRAICGSSSGGICAFTVAWSGRISFGRCFRRLGVSRIFAAATITGVDPQDGAETDSRVPAGWVERFE